MIKAQTAQTAAHLSVVGSTGGTLFTWISENANVLTVLFTGAGFVATCLFYVVSIRLKMRESNCSKCDID